MSHNEFRRPVVDPRLHQVSVRLTQSEYDEVKEICEDQKISIASLLDQSLRMMKKKILESKRKK